MTIAVVLKIGDGIVLGADSASTLRAGTGVNNVYFNAEKLFNLVKGWPIGTLTYGLGGLDGRSVYNLSKELRELLTGGKDWKLSRRSYTIQQAAERLQRFFFEKYYRTDFPENSLKDGEYPLMGFIVAGYSANETQPEIWGITIDSSGHCKTKELAGPKLGAVIFAEGQNEAAARVLRGWSGTVLQGLVDLGIPVAEAAKFLQSLPYTPLIHSAMPLQDGIDLVQYVIDIQAGFVRFNPGAPTVSEPVDLAAITQHEGFRWIRRKLWHTLEFNPPHPK